MTAYHVGIDLHKFVAQVCVRDSTGERRAERRYGLETQYERDRMMDDLEDYGPSARYAVEALGCNRWFVLECQARGMELLVVDACQLDLKRTGKKTDKRDAREISRRLHLGDLDRHARTHFAPEEEHGTRKLIRVRHALKDQRTSLAAQIRGPLNAYAIRPPAGTLYTGRMIAWLRLRDFGNEELNAAFQVLVDLLERTQAAISKLDVLISKRARNDAFLEWMVANLNQMGALTAVTLVAELGDASRFKRARCVASYGGVVPRITASADHANHGRMTKRGNREIRYILGQWAVRLMTHDPLVQKWAAPMLRRMNKNKVRMALARRLLVGVWVMLARGEVFSMERCLGLSA